MGTATGPPEAVAALHGPRLESLLAAIVDTPVRGVVYEVAGSVDTDLLARGAEIARRAAAAHRIPIELIERPPDDHAAWLEAAVLAATRPLADPA